MFLVYITSFNDVLINLMCICQFCEYKDAYFLLSTADIIENEHISILKQAFFPMSLSLHKTAQQNLVSIV